MDGKKEIYRDVRFFHGAIQLFVVYSHIPIQLHSVDFCCTTRVQHCCSVPPSFTVLCYLSCVQYSRHSFPSHIALHSLRFNGHFPGEPGLASVYWCKGWWRWWWQLDYWSYKSCKAPVKSSPPTDQDPVFTGRMPFLSPIQQSQSTEGKISHSMDLLTPSSPGGVPTLSLTTNSSWLPWGRVAMPLISPLKPVPIIALHCVWK